MFIFKTSKEMGMLLFVYKAIHKTADVNNLNYSANALDIGSNYSFTLLHAFYSSTVCLDTYVSFVIN